MYTDALKKTEEDIQKIIDGEWGVGGSVVTSTFLEILNTVRLALGVALDTVGRKYDFHLETVPEESDPLYAQHMCWSRIYDMGGYINVVAYIIRSRSESGETTLNLGQVEADAIKIAAYLLNEAYAYMTAELELPTPPVAEEAPN